MDKTIGVILIVAAFTAGAIYKLRQTIYSRPRVSHVREIEGEAKVATKSCQSTELRLAWPINGVAGTDWVIANYFDDDLAPGRVQDFTGALGQEAVTYDGHDGVDIEIPSFRTMDQGVPVLASAPGEVEDLSDGAFDRNRVCSSEKWNFVTIRHANGFATTYGHMKKGSVAVKRGDQVSAGTRLGLVGSSGCSSHPHVHIDVSDCNGKRFDPVKENLFIMLPAYSKTAPSDVMESYVLQPAVNELERVQDPGPTDTQIVSAGHRFTVAVTLSHLKAGDVVRIDFLRPDNSEADFFMETQLNHFFPRSHWWGNFVADDSGVWLARFKVNGKILGTRSITVSQ